MRINLANYFGLLGQSDPKQGSLKLHNVTKTIHKKIQFCKKKKNILLADTNSFRFKFTVFNLNVVIIKTLKYREMVVLCMTYNT